MATALLIVDVQRGMFEVPDAQPHDGPAAVARIRGLLDRARASGVPVFFVQHDGGEGDVLAADSTGFPFVSELTPKPTEVVTVKRECDAFQATDLADKLQKAGVDHLLVCGMQTEMCVNAAVRAAANRGFGVTLVSDAHTTFDTAESPAERIIAQHNEALDSVATVIPSAEIVF
jgi:nicotinamidase-related amidase